jgi:acetyl esterase/lipase
MTTSNPTSQQPAIVPLYPDGAPGSEDWDQKEQLSDIAWAGFKVARNVTQPTLTAYLPEPAKSRGTGIIVCPGGAWHFLAVEHEGIDVARWLNARGIAAFILKYRLIKTGDDYEKEMQTNMADRDRMASLLNPLRPLLLKDGQQAVNVVREKAIEWEVNADRIGMMGFSAGGSLAVNVALRNDIACRPDFTAAIYTADWDDAPVPPDATPMFILCAADDEMASPNSIRLYTEWRNAGKPAELHIYAKGGHGFGMLKNDLPTDMWIDRFVDWLDAQGF